MARELSLLWGFFRFFTPLLQYEMNQGPKVCCLVVLYALDVMFDMMRA